MKLTLEQINSMIPNTLMETLGIRYTEVGDALLVAEMEVTPRLHQPLGYLHGGATIALAESVGSMASVLLVDPREFAVLGTQINATHLRSVESGTVTAKAKLINQGKSMHVWDVEVFDQEQKLMSVVRISNSIKPRRK